MKLLLLSLSCLSVLISLSSVYGQSKAPEDLYDECVNVAGKSLCDFLFKNSTSTNKYTDVQSNYANSTNTVDLSNLTYSTYIDKDNGFSIDVPKNWLNVHHNSMFNTVTGFSPPDNYNAFVDVRIFPQGDYKSIKEVGDKEFKNGDTYTLLGYYRNKTTELSGKPAFRAIYLVTSTSTFAENLQGVEPEQYKGLYVGTLVPEKKSIYAIAYLANPADFDTYRPIFEKMIDSFKISGKGPVIQEDNSSSSKP